MTSAILRFSVMPIFVLGLSVAATAQFPKIPKLPTWPKTEAKQPAPEAPATPNKAASLPASRETNSAPAAAPSTSKDELQWRLPAATILKPLLTVRAVRDLNYWKQPAAKNFWSWMPKVEFTVTGPIPDASYFTFEFTTPEGQPWFSYDTEPIAVAEGQTRNIESQAVKSWTDKRSTIATGVFGFKVTLKNALQGTAKVMYQGKYKVNKQFAGTPHPDFKNQFAFFVEQDWALPVGYVTFDPREVDAPVLAAAMWFRGQWQDHLAAYLFYNGKQISSTKTNGSYLAKAVLTEADDKKTMRWELWRFSFLNVVAFDNNGQRADAHLLKRNPGTYEIKVLLDGELVRTTSFVVGSDGKIVDNGVAAKNGFGGMGVVVPVKILPSKEGAVDLQAWKLDAFYGNPLQGFLVP